jgi:hypothetical protein
MFSAFPFRHKYEYNKTYIHGLILARGSVPFFEQAVVSRSVK